MATRIRRGKEVEIPPEWVNKFPTQKTMRDRQSRKTRKQKRKAKPGNAFLDQRDLPIED